MMNESAEKAVMPVVTRECGAIELSANGVKMKTVAECAEFCRLLQAGGMIPKGMTVEGAVIATLAGARLGLDPFQSVQGIASINGRPAIWGDALVAIVKGSGLVEDEAVEYLPTRSDCKGVRYSVKRKGVPTPYVGTFSKADAEKAGLWGKGVWQAYPARMMFNRARAFALRDGFADVLRGFRIAEEEQDSVTAQEAPTQEQEAPQLPRRRTRASASELLSRINEKQAQAITVDAVDVKEAPAETVTVDAPAETQEATPEI